MTGVLGTDDEGVPTRLCVLLEWADKTGEISMLCRAMAWRELVAPEDYPDGVASKGREVRFRRKVVVSMR